MGGWKAVISKLGTTGPSLCQALCTVVQVVHCTTSQWMGPPRAVRTTAIAAALGCLHNNLQVNSN